MTSNLKDIGWLSCQKKALWYAAYNDSWGQNTESVWIFLTGYIDMRNNAENKSSVVQYIFGMYIDVICDHGTWYRI